MKNKQELVVFVFQKDLRLNDNPGLYNAVNLAKLKSLKFLPIYIISEQKTQNIGNNQYKILSKILVNLKNDLPSFRIFRGNAIEIIKYLSNSFELHLFANDSVEPNIRNLHTKFKNLLGTKFELFKDSISIDSDTKTQNNHLYSIFTPFKNRVWESFLHVSVLPKISTDNLQFLDTKIFDSQVFQAQISKSSEFLEENILQHFSQNSQLQLEKDTVIDISEILDKTNCNWVDTKENDILQNFTKFVQNNLRTYDSDRNSLSKDALHISTSKMSIALAFGIVSSRQLKEIILQNFTDLSPNLGTLTYVSELIWREFYRYLIWHDHKLVNTEFQVKKRNIPWQKGQRAIDIFQKWCVGQTGYDIVDSGMQQLNQTGWMHNRVRMIVSSVLTKNFGIDWRWGQAYFQSLLLDFDLASNNGGWQWGASVGADPKPIRIFNPYLQAQKFDPDFEYRFKWLGIEKFSKNSKGQPEYTLPAIIDHKIARQEALERYGQAKTLVTNQNILFA